MKSKQKSLDIFYTFLNKKCYINQENIWKKPQKNKMQLVIPRLSLFLGHS